MPGIEIAKSSAFRVPREHKHGSFLCPHRIRWTCAPGVRTCEQTLECRKGLRPRAGADQQENGVAHFSLTAHKAVNSSVLGALMTIRSPSIAGDADIAAPALNFHTSLPVFPSSSVKLPSFDPNEDASIRGYYRRRIDPSLRHETSTAPCPLFASRACIILSRPPANTLPFHTAAVA